MNNNKKRQKQLNYKIFEADDKELNISSTPILFINNFNTDFSSFTCVANSLRSEFKVILYNPYVDIDNIKFVDIDSIVISLHEFIISLNLDSIHIITNGISSLIADKLAHKYPDYVKSMIFEDFSINFKMENELLDIDYSKINKPTLLMRGSKSQNMLPDQNQKIVMSNDILRSTSVENVENNGHFNNVDGFVSQVSKFISIFS